MKIGLGTVQFGLDYGISNPGGQSSREEAAGILEFAHECGIRVLDTAALYGEGEEVLGKAIQPGRFFKIVTKTPRFNEKKINLQHAQLLEDTFHRSLARLGSNPVYGLLAHEPGDLLSEGGELLWERMISLKERGLVSGIGASVYSIVQIEGLLEKYAPDIIQLPVNVLDQRLVNGGHLAALKKTGVEIHARSAFLQGLLLMEPLRLPTYFEPVREHLIRYHNAIRGKGITPLSAALGFACSLPEVDTVLCGVNNRGQLEEICNSLKVSFCMEDPKQFAFYDEKILDPSMWKLQDSSNLTG